MSEKKSDSPDERRGAADSRALQMADVARLANVSVATVSRSLSGSKLVKPETRERVQELARSLNYTINVGAQNLRLGQNRTVAVVVPFDRQTRQHLTDPFFQSILASLADALTERGHDMLVSRVDAEELDAVTHLRQNGRAVGTVMIGQWRHHDQLNELALAKFPLVVWGAQLNQQLYCTVGGNNVRGGVLATRHLISQGHRRIAFFGDVAMPEAALRYQGYCEALAAAGIALDPELCIATDFTAASARQSTLELCLRQVQFDAVFAVSDLMAMTVINTLREKGLRVPDDVSVVGYDDVDIAQYFHPPLTTIRQPIDVAGRALVDALFNVLEGHSPQNVLLPTLLMERGSTRKRQAG